MEAFVEISEESLGGQTVCSRLGVPASSCLLGGCESCDSDVKATKQAGRTRCPVFGMLSKRSFR
jgi:hypothetical protein